MKDGFTRRFCVMFASQRDTTYTTYADNLTVPEAGEALLKDARKGKHVIYDKLYNEVVFSVEL
jgi:hypothetical protein